MRAIVYTKYGGPEVLRTEEVELPLVGNDDVLIRVCAASVNRIECYHVRGVPYVVRLFTGLRRPKRTAALGIDFAGIVESVGSNVTDLIAGDEVFGGCDGAFSEYVCGSEGDFARKPSASSFEQAAALPIAGVTALQALRDHGKVQAGHHVLVIGAGGGVGTFAVQIARALGAEVTGVCSASKLELVRSIGATHVIDYAVEDIVAAGHHQYDVIVDCVGDRSLTANRRALTVGGTLVIVGGGSSKWLGPMGTMLKAKIQSRFIKQKIVFCIGKINQGDLVVLAKMVEGGSVSPVVGRSFHFRDAGAAIRLLEEGHALGKTVLTNNQPSEGRDRIESHQSPN